MCIKLLFHNIKIQPFHGITVQFKLITMHAWTPKHNNSKRHDRLGYRSICYIGSKIGWRWDHRLQYKTSSWYLNGFPSCMVVTLGRQYTYINRHAGTPDKNNNKTCLVCVVVFSSHLFWTSRALDVPAGVTQEEGHAGFLIHLLSAVRALIFLARRI